MKVWIVMTIAEGLGESGDVYADILGVYSSEEKANKVVDKVREIRGRDDDDNDAWEELHKLGAVEEFDTVTTLEWEVE